MQLKYRHETDLRKTLLYTPQQMNNGLHGSHSLNLITGIDFQADSK